MHLVLLGDGRTFAKAVLVGRQQTFLLPIVGRLGVKIRIKLAQERFDLGELRQFIFFLVRILLFTLRFN